MRSYEDALKDCYWYDIDEKKWKKNNNQKGRLFSIYILKDVDAGYSVGSQKKYVVMWCDKFMGRFKYLKSAQTVGELLYEG